MTCRWTASAPTLPRSKAKAMHRLLVVGRAGHTGVVGHGQLAAFGEALFHGRVGADGRVAKPALCRGIGVAPVDAVIVATRAQDVLAHVPTRSSVRSPAVCRDHSTCSLVALTANCELVLS